MRNLVSVKVKANAHYTCQECGATELIQTHHEILGDDDSLIVLCADCHSKRHPNVPRALFFSTKNQPYWHNKSASSLAKELGVCPRTIIRAARRLRILPGELTPWDEELIKNNIPKLQWNNPKLELGFKYLTAPQVRERLGFSRFQFDIRIELGILPQPTYVDKTSGLPVRYFDENWVRIAQAILDNAAQGNK